MHLKHSETIPATLICGKIVWKKRNRSLVPKRWGAAAVAVSVRAHWNQNSAECRHPGRVAGAASWPSHVREAWPPDSVPSPW